MHLNGQPKHRWYYLIASNTDFLTVNVGTGSPPSFQTMVSNSIRSLSISMFHPLVRGTFTT